MSSPETLEECANRVILEFEEARAAWSTIRDSGTRHITALGNAVQEATYVSPATQDKLAPEYAARNQSMATSPLERAGQRALDSCKIVKNRECVKLHAKIDQLTDLVMKMQAGYNSLQTCWNKLRDKRIRSANAEAPDGNTDKLSSMQTPIGVTWVPRDFLNSLADIIDSYRTELVLKASIVEDVTNQSDPDIMLSYSAAFLSEPYISEDHIFSQLEAAKYELQHLRPQ